MLKNLKSFFKNGYKQLPQDEPQDAIFSSELKKQVLELELQELKPRPEKQVLELELQELKPRPEKQVLESERKKTLLMHR
ncbi:hypothetical protein [Bartonella sp. C271]|uniref:hypothetical protein n=1 Tax=Bartonella sp. C271 TaxID=3070220 RepID=UPI0038B505B6